MDLKSLLNTNTREVQAPGPVYGSKVLLHTSSDTFSTTSKADRVDHYKEPSDGFDVGASDDDNDANSEGVGASEYRRCIWCHKKDIKSRLKRGVTFVVGRPRAGWEEARLPLCYTCCGCYEQRRKGRNLDHKMETLKAQYQAFDTFGVRYYEIRKKRYGGRWEEWLGTASEVWIELYHSYHIEKSFAGLKASPVLDLDERTIRKRIKRRRESTDEEVVVDDSDDADADLQVGRLEYDSLGTNPPGKTGIKSSMQSAYEQALHYLVALMDNFSETLTEMSGASAQSPVHPSVRSKSTVATALPFPFPAPTPAALSSSPSGRDARVCGGGNGGEGSSGAGGAGSPGGGSDLNTSRTVGSSKRKQKKQKMRAELGRDCTKRQKRHFQLAGHSESSKHPDTHVDEQGDENQGESAAEEEEGEGQREEVPDDERGKDIESDSDGCIDEALDKYRDKDKDRFRATTMINDAARRVSNDTHAQPSEVGSRGKGLRLLRRHVPFPPSSSPSSSSSSSPCSSSSACS